MASLGLVLLGMSVGFFLGVVYCRTDDLIEEMSRPLDDNLFACNCGDMLDDGLIHTRSVCYPEREAL